MEEAAGNEKAVSFYPFVEQRVRDSELPRALSTYRECFRGTLLTSCLQSGEIGDRKAVAMVSSGARTRLAVNLVMVLTTLTLCHHPLNATQKRH